MLEACGAVEGSTPSHPTVYEVDIGWRRWTVNPEVLTGRASSILVIHLWDGSSIGRAPRLQRGGCGFESHPLHLTVDVV
jgi:hypothetical protein